MDIKRCFEILEIDAGASLDEVNQAYRDLVSIWHPDRFSGNPRLKIKSENKLKEINEAYKKTISFFSSRQEDPQTTHKSGKQSVSHKTFNSDLTRNVSFPKTPSQSKLDSKGSIFYCFVQFYFYPYLYLPKRKRSYRILTRNSIHPISNFPQQNLQMILLLI